MKKGENFNHPKSGVQIKVEPVNYPAHRAGHLKTILAVLETSLVRDDI